MPNTNQGLRMAALLSAVAIVIFTLSAVLFLNTQEQPLDNILPWIVGWCGPTIPALLGYALLDRKLDSVHREVNGNTTNLIDANRELSGEIKTHTTELSDHTSELAELISRLGELERRQQQ